jgi:hypothetical protein
MGTAMCKRSLRGHWCALTEGRHGDIIISQADLVRFLVTVIGKTPYESVKSSI